MDQVKVTIDGREIVTGSQKTIFKAAEEAGIYIPNICQHPDLPPSGECGLCIVEIDGSQEPVISCNTKVVDGMRISTHTPSLQAKQREALKIILKHHPTACLTCWRRERCKPFDICLRNVDVSERCVTCPKNGRCELQRVADYIDLKTDSVPYEYRGLPVNRDNPLFELDYNLCIACGRCIRACNDLRGIKALDFVQVNGHRVAGPKNGTHKDSGCKYCFSCVEVCPTGALMDIKDGRYGAYKDFEAYVVPCTNACPAHIDIPRYLYYIARGRYPESLAVIREKVPFPGVLGRVCIHPCEQACRRGDLNSGQPICIKFLKRYAADHDNGLWKKYAVHEAPTGRKVAIVGSGPSGLTAAYYLAKKGHGATVFEALPQAGGMMRVGIPRYRLPATILDSEIDEIKSAGVEIRLNSRVESLDKLFDEGYDAIFVAIGAHKGMPSGVKGDDTPGFIDGVTFLRNVSLGENVKLGNRVGITGGGNSAVDCARTALRLGAKKVIMFYRRTRVEMPAAPEEVEEALHEGVEIVFLVAPNEIRKRADGALDFECTRMKLGEPDASGRRRPEPIPGSEFVTILDNVISGIGQATDIPSGFGLDTGRGNVIRVKGNSLETTLRGVFAGGDIVTGPASVIGAISHGRQAASEIDKYLGGNGIITEALLPEEAADPYFGEDAGFTERYQPAMPCIPDNQRTASFIEVELGYGEKTAAEEAARCFRCNMRLKINAPVLPPAKVVTARTED